MTDSKKHGPLLGLVEHDGIILVWLSLPRALVKLNWG